MSKRLKKIVCLGGGNAMPKAVLSELKKHPVKISAICAMLDSGGSAGRLRKDYKIVSPGDIRRAFVALADTSPIVENLFNYRFETGELKGHNFANLLITALELSSRDYEEALEEVKKLLKVKHEVLPATLDNSQLYAELENGKIISGETNIDIPKHDKRLKIKRIFLKPKAEAYSKTKKAIRNADLIVIGPGDLYSSLAQIFLINGISKSIRNSKAKKVYICNAMTKLGETNKFSVTDFVNEIEKFLEGPLDYVIFNTKKPSLRKIKECKKEHPELSSFVKFDKELLENEKYIGRELLSDSKCVHDPKKLNRILLKLCKL